MQSLFFDDKVAKQSQNAKSSVNVAAKTFRQLLEKTPVFDSAYVQEMLSKQKYVTVPVAYTGKELYLKAGRRTPRMAYFTYLIFYLDEKQEKHVELVTKFPDEAYLIDTSKTKKFSGDIVIEDWYGNYTKGFKYVEGIVTKLIDVPARSMGKTIVNSFKKLNEVDCIRQDFYVQVTVNFSEKPKATNVVYVSYDYSEWHCYFSPTPVGGGGDFGGGFSGLTGADYAIVGGGTPSNPSGGPGSDCPQDQKYKGGKVINGCPLIVQTIKFTDAFKQNEKLQCVYGKLLALSADWRQDGSSLVANLFATFSQDDDIIFDLGHVDNASWAGTTDDITGFFGGQKYRVTINVDNYANRTALQNAQTIIHEAMHAYIERAIHYSGNSQNFFDKLKQYRNFDPTDDPNLNEHEYIANFYIDPFARALKSLDGNLHDLDYYRSLAWEGLLDTTQFQALPEDQKQKIKSDIFNEGSNADKNCH
ncbi:hypothetical protein MUY27_13845 [Mucilaginibacter sp. RS28]|uniref:Uncharacterized protein n=1 Tax=Mucilaginibacter straminoryzae TaxID=2932774 RepID=A0A9X2B9V2_9SPHI|nr:hypothetical protein [Mucilaginibacter straminoryzae]MCJ8210796.1 hypothetical protein [Mucilaginibacter straminoryzae]